MNVENSRLVSYFKLLSRFAGLFAVVVGALVLAGWVLDIAVLKSVLADAPSMKANAALCILLSGISLWLLTNQNQPAQGKTTYAAGFCASLVALVGLLTLCQYLFQVDFHIDQLLHEEKVVSVATSHPGRMAPSAATCLVLLGLGLLFLNVEWRLPRWSLRVAPSQYAALLNSLIAWVIFVGYLYKVPIPQGPVGTSVMAFPTAVTLAMLGIGILFARPQKGLMSVLLNGRMGSVTLLRLLPAAIALPLVLGWLRLQGEKAGLFQTEFGVALVATSTILMFVGLLWWNAESLNKADYQRQCAQEVLRDREAFVQAVLRVLPVGVVVANQDGVITLSNEASKRIWSGARHVGVDEYGEYKGWWADTGQRIESHEWGLARAVTKGETSTGEIINIECFDGSRKTINNSAVPLLDGQGAVAGAIVVLQDITRQQQAQQRANHLHEVLQAVRGVSQIILREKDRQSLLGQACELLVQARGYSLAWVGLIEDGHHRVIPVASAGVHADYPIHAVITWDESETGQGPTGTAIRTRQPCVITHPASDPRYAPWREAVQARGLESAAAVPIHYASRVFGALNVYANSEAAFDSEEVQLLQDLANDLAFALYSIETEALRKESEAKLRESEERFQQAFDFAAIGMALVGLDGSWIQVNPALCEITGYSPEELASTTFQAITHPDDLEADLGYVQQLLDGSRSSYQMEKRYFHKNGDTIWILLTGSLVHDAQQNPRHFVAQVQNITAHKLAEAQLRESEERFRVTFEQAAVGIGMVTLEGRWIKANPQLSKITGYSQEELQQRTISDVTHADDREDERELLRQLLAGEIPIYQIEKRYIRRDGGLIWVRVSRSLVRDAQAEPEYFVGIVEDITARKQAEDELRRMADDLARSNSELEQFAYVASHDLQEPLRKIISYTQLLEEMYGEKLDADAQEFMRYTVDGAIRMRQIIIDLLAFSRVGTHNQSVEAVDCQAVVNYAIEDLGTAIQESEAVITYDELPVVHGNPVQLRQVFHNLIGNAIKFRGDATPQIHITAKLQPQSDSDASETTREEKNQEWLFAVRDKGIGIEPQFFDRIFTIFQRLHTRAEYSGTGIGLALCRKIVNRHGGRIWVESEPAQGSTFYFTLPVTTIEAKAKEL